MVVNVLPGTQIFQGYALWVESRTRKEKQGWFPVTLLQ